MNQIRVTVWGENRHEQTEEHVAKLYPDGMHETIAAGIREHLGVVWVAPGDPVDLPLDVPEAQDRRLTEASPGTVR